MRKMNNRGQFSIIAALFVAVILITTVTVTYSSIRYAPSSDDPQILSAIDETNLALKQVLGFTVGYYGSVLQVTGNSSYGQLMASNYLNSGLENIANMRPEWGTSFDLQNLSLSANWFMNESFSSGTLTVNYSLTGLGVSGITYTSTSELEVQISPSNNPNQVCLTLSDEQGAPISGLVLQNFKFYLYQYSNLTWQMTSPPCEPVSFSNGTYLLNVTSGVNPLSYSIQVQDTRGITVAASSFSHYTGTLTFNNTSVQGGQYVNNSNSKVDGLSDVGTHSNFTAQQYGPDNVYDAVTEANSAVTNQIYNPSSYSLDGGTTLVSGSPSNLVSDDGSYMTFGAYGSSTSAQTLYAHKETTTISGTSYNESLLASADTTGATLSSSMAGARSLFDKSVYSLQGITTIPASTWTIYYRAWQDSTSFSSIVKDATNSGTTGSNPSSSLSWSHTTSSGSNRIMIVGVSIGSGTVTVSTIKYGSQSLTYLRRDHSASESSELWYLVAPNAGTATVAVTLSANAKAVGGSATFTGVSQTAPVIGDSSGTTGNSNSPSQSVTVNTANSFLVGNLGTSDSITVSENGGTKLWDASTGGTPKPVGHGSYKGPVATGGQSLSWSLSGSINWAVSVLAIKPAQGAAAVGHVDVDILIREANGAIRSTIATTVAASANLPYSQTTLSGTYAFPSYNVVSQSDYLEVDYYVDPTTSAGSNAYLSIDNNTLALVDQTRIANVMLPSQFTCQAEVSSSSNLNNWNSAQWAMDASSTVNNVNAVFQLFDYKTSQYQPSGSGYLSTTLGTSITANNQNITSNPTDFRDALGNWKIRFTVTSSSQFNISVDSSAINSGSAIYSLNLEEQWTNVNTTYLSDHPYLCVYLGSSGPAGLAIDSWNSSTSSWQTLSSSLIGGWNNVSIGSHLTWPQFTVRFRGNGSLQNAWQIDALLLRPQSDQQLFASLQDPSAVVTAELLQNGTILWLGQSLQLSSQTIPIPPVPVKDIQVKETVGGVSSEVPFQIEDWSSAYTVPLGLTDNATVFGNRQMIVFLVNTQVSDFTVWWNGSDQAVQSPLAYTNSYFNDNPSGGTVSNGKLSLSISGSFTVTSTVVGKGTTSTSTFMRINSQASTYGAGAAYVIVNGVVRDIIQQEAEWNNGVTNCPNLYANIVLTLPANASYYTYQLRLMFLASSQVRTISDLCPVKLSTSINQLQTENGTLFLDPLVVNDNGVTYYYNQPAGTMHHFSQFISGTKGAGIMFADSANRQLYCYDSMAGGVTGALKTSTTAETIELMPVSTRSVTFQTAMDVTWQGAVATFDGTTPIYAGQGQPGLWILAELPPTISVTTGN
ncbi:MAG TPA: hypothetical protein VMD05_09790 [Candidatus Nanoarchaeia archaeon]|nr:hypothetical protein [Candidatus Nanoarchaeia archaeon]